MLNWIPYRIPKLKIRTLKIPTNSENLKKNTRKCEIDLICGQIKRMSKAGASNLRPRNIFVRPKLDSEFKGKKIGILTVFL
jgi:hypothetical protein